MSVWVVEYHSPSGKWLPMFGNGLYVDRALADCHASNLEITDNDGIAYRAAEYIRREQP